MVDIVVADDVFIQGQVHSTTVQQAIQVMKDDPNPTRPKAKGKWLEVVQLKNGERLAMNCQREGDKIVISGIRPLKKSKPVGPPRR
jgi:ribosomal protein S17